MKMPAYAGVLLPEVLVFLCPARSSRCGHFFESQDTSEPLFGMTVGCVVGHGAMPLSINRQKFVMIQASQVDEGMSCPP